MAGRVQKPPEPMEEAVPMITGLGNTLLDRLSGSGLEEDFTMLTRTIVRDGLGGYKETYVIGTGFTAVLKKDTTAEDRVAEKQGAKESFHITVSKGFPFSFHDVFKSEKSKETYRITSKTPDHESPDNSNISISSWPAERWDLPT